MRTFFARLRNWLLLGLVFLLGLELALQAVHFAFFAGREAASPKELGAAHFRVLCIGESTTVGYPHGRESPHSYPRLLEERLQREFPSLSFQVVNRGLNAATSAQILESLPEWLEQHRPHAVVAMLGANDVFYHADAYETWLPARLRLVLQKLRTYRLAGLIREQLRRLAAGAPAAEPEIPEETTRRIFAVYERGVERFEKGDWLASERHFRRVHQMITSRRDPQAKSETRRVTRLPASLLGLYHQSVSYLGKLHLRQGRAAEAIGLYRSSIEVEPDLPILRFELSNLYAALGRPREAQQLREEAQELLARFVLRSTQANYRHIRDRVVASGATLVAMQYPLRDVNHLKLLFPEPEGLAFVDNGASFSRAMERESFPAYFSDRFAGDFGHLTRRGNQLLVENLVDQALSRLVRRWADGRPSAKDPRAVELP